MEDSRKKIEGCLPQNLLSPLLNTLSQIQFTILIILFTLLSRFWEKKLTLLNNISKINSDILTLPTLHISENCIKIHINLIVTFIFFKILLCGDSNGIRTHNHLVCKKLAFLAKWLSVRLRTKWLWVRIPLLTLKLQILCLKKVKINYFRQLLFRYNFQKCKRREGLMYSHFSQKEQLLTSTDFKIVDTFLFGGI